MTSTGQSIWRKLATTVIIVPRAQKLKETMHDPRNKAILSQVVEFVLRSTKKINLLDSSQNKRH